MLLILMESWLCMLQAQDDAVRMRLRSKALWPIKIERFNFFAVFCKRRSQGGNIALAIELFCNKRIGAEKVAFKRRVCESEFGVLRADYGKNADCCFKWAESGTVYDVDLDAMATFSTEFGTVGRIGGFQI